MTSQDRDLRTGEPVWNGYKKPRIANTPLTANINTDILIIGAGISGAMVAEALSGHGLDIVMVEKRKPLSGSTSASTALLQYEIDTPLIHLQEKIGQAKAAAAWRRSKLGLESLAAKIRELDIECGYERRDTVYLSGNVLNPKQLAQECLQRSLISLPGKMLSKKELRQEYGIKGDAGLLSWDNIICNPVQLAGGFLKVAIEKGVRIYSPVEVIAHRKSGNYIVAITNEGYEIKTRFVIFTTGYEIPDDIKTRKHKIHSTWALATKKIKGLQEKMPMVWEAADPYIYARSTSDDRIIFGGEDEDFENEERRDALMPEKQRALERKLKKIFPDLEFETDYMWTGLFGGSTNGLPSIGRIPNQKNCYAVMAYGGNGITFSRIAAEIVAADILGHKDPDAELFSFK